MKGKFIDIYHVNILTFLGVIAVSVLLLWLIIGIFLLIDSLALAMIGAVPASLLIPVAMAAVAELLNKGSYTADETCITFRKLLLKKTYHYEEIASVGVTTIIPRSGYRNSAPHIQLEIRLNDGKVIYYRDVITKYIGEDVEMTRYRTIEAGHPFTALSEYIKKHIHKDETD